MKNYKCLILCILVTFTSAWGQSKYHVKGSVDHLFNGNPIFLFTFTNDGIIHRVDTSYVNEGTFFFEGNSDLTSLAVVSSGNYPNKVLFGQIALEEGVILLNLDSISKVSGTPLNELYQNYLDTIGGIMEMTDRQISAFEIDFFKKNISNIVGKALFIEKGLRWDNPKDFYDIYNRSDSLWKESKLIKETYLRLRKLDDMENRRAALDGENYHDFVFKDFQGGEKRISDYIGKSKLLVFDVWASWCAPCRAEMPIWKDLYSTYTKNDLTIVSISLDDNEVAWKNAIRKLELPWEQLIVSKELVDEFKQFYGIMIIPHGICIGQDGKIIKSGMPAQLAKLVFPKLIK